MRLSNWVAMRCQDPGFWHFMGTKNEQETVVMVRSLCQVKSRAELDKDPEAAARCDEQIRHPYTYYINERSTNV